MTVIDVLATLNRDYVGWPGPLMRSGAHVVGSSSARGDERPGCIGDGDVFSTRVGFGESSAGIPHRTATAMAESPVDRGGDCGQGAMREVRFEVCGMCVRAVIMT